MLTPAYYLHCLLTVVVAVCFSDVLVRDGMLLAPVQRWARKWYNTRYTNVCREIYADLDTRPWWKPLWGCPTCVCGQWAFWAYVVHYHGPAYRWDEHAYFVALALLFALILQKLLQWSQR